MKIIGGWIIIRSYDASFYSRNTTACSKTTGILIGMQILTIFLFYWDLLGKKGNNVNAPTEVTWPVRIAQFMALPLTVMCHNVSRRLHHSNQSIGRPSITLRFWSNIPTRLNRLCGQPSSCVVLLERYWWLPALSRSCRQQKSQICL